MHTYSRMPAVARNTNPARHQECYCTVNQSERERPFNNLGAKSAPHEERERQQQRARPKGEFSPWIYADWSAAFGRLALIGHGVSALTTTRFFARIADAARSSAVAPIPE